MAFQIWLAATLFMVEFVLRTEATVCSNAPMDIVFVLDSSDGARSPNFQKEKQFTTVMVQLLSLSHNMFGLITNGNLPEPSFYMNSYQTAAEVMAAIPYTFYSTGKGTISAGIDFGIEEGFGNTNGDRLSSPNIMILLTHSAINNETLALKLAAKLRQHKIELFVIIMGSNPNYWFSKIAQEDWIIQVNNFVELIASAPTITNTICRGRGVMLEWSHWTQCGATCGSGLRRRFRSCDKRNVDDEDCVGDVMENERCNILECTDPVDGGWTYWDKWSKCSKTCGTGTMTRKRFCVAPFPAYGGKPCPGPSTERKQCSKWSCPDCTRRCPDGGTLSSKCDICECISTTLFGYVYGFTQRPVSDARILLHSRMYEPLTTTDHTGWFNVSGLCILGDTVVVEREKYESATPRLSQVNLTHWNANTTMLELIAPIFNIQPQHKTRLVGQNVTLCCKALGYPTVTNYTWFKDKTPLEGKGSSGTLIIPLVAHGDSGVYVCQTQTDAGTTKSEEGVLTIKDGTNDSFGIPKSRLEDLPEQCYESGDSSKSSNIDVGTCGNSACVTRSLRDNGTCSEWWPHYCWDASEMVPVDIQCDGFTYQMSRVTKCECKSCRLKTSITGKAFGRNENGTVIPFKRGSIYYQSNKIATTNVVGFFNFELPNTIERVVLYFKDHIYKTFMETTKVITVTKGTSSSMSFVLPLNPTPFEFHSDIGQDIEVGKSINEPPSGRISLPKDAVFNQDGSRYQGSVTAIVHHMDPRKLSDIEACIGEFTYEEDGVMHQLETFGISTCILKDTNGNALKINKPITFEIDQSVFNVSVKTDGQPDIDLWHFDEIKGIWKFDSAMHFASSATNRRKLLQNQNVIVGDLSAPVYMEKINLQYQSSFNVVDHYQNVFDHYNSVLDHYERQVVDTRWSFIGNLDTKVNIYGNVPVYRNESEYRNDTVYIEIMETHTKRGACFASVRVYQSFSTKDPDTGGTQVFAVTKELGESRYKGFDKAPTDTNGHVCLKIFCDSEVYIYAENKLDATRLHAFPKHDVPPGFNVTNTKNSTEIVLLSLNFEEVIQNGVQRYSPIYYFKDLAKCKNDFDKNYNFRFGPLTKDPKYNFKVSENTFDDKHSWYPFKPDAPTRRTCFIKVLIKEDMNYIQLKSLVLHYVTTVNGVFPIRIRLVVKDNFEMRILASSYQNDTKAGGSYGMHDVGPIPDPTYRDLNTRAACLEYRCAGAVNDKGTIIYSVPTLLEARINPLPNKACKYRPLNNGIKVNPLPGQNGFQFHAVSDDNYGPMYGVYISNSDRHVVRNFCYNGRDTGRLDLDMKPTVNAAVEFDCT